jgi:hypothetical protein
MIHIEIRLDDAETGAMSWRAAQGGARWKRARDLETIMRAADKECGEPSTDNPREIDYVVAPHKATETVIDEHCH